MLKPLPGCRDRARGALLGQLIGDALGTTVEFLDEATVAARHPGGLREIVGGGPFQLLPGQVTDDSELALALARSIVAEGGYREDAVAAAYVDWYRSRPFDIGGTIAAAFSLEPEPAKGLAERMRARASTSSQANGSLMRASPLGILGAGLKPKRLAELAAADSSLSHPHPVPRDACGAFCHALSTAIRDRLNARETYEKTLAFAWSADLTDEVRNTLVEAPHRAPADYQTHISLGAESEVSVPHLRSPQVHRPHFVP